MRADNPPAVPPPRDTQDADSIAPAVRTIASLTLLSRIGGLARDLVTARVFQDSLAGSAFAAAFAIPNLFRRLLGEGALAGAFLPEYTSALRDGLPTAHALLRWTLARLLAVTSLLTIAGEVLLFVLLGTLDDPHRVFSLRLIMVMLPLMPMVCLTAILAAALQAHGRFAPGAAAPIILNICIIAGALLHFFGPRLDPRASAYAIGGAAIIAGVAQLAWCGAALRRRMPSATPPADAGPHARAVLTRFVPVAIGMGTMQINALLDTVIAMWPTWVGPTMLLWPVPLDERSNAVLSYTQRLYQFPLGVFGIAVATAAFPALSRLRDRREDFFDALRTAMGLSLFIALPASVGLLLVREDLTRVMFGGVSGFSDDGLARASAVLAAYAVGVWAYSLNHVLVRACYASGDTSTPTRVALASVGLNLLSNLTLVWFLREAGLALSTAISQVAQVGVLFFVLRRRGARLPAHTTRFLGMSVAMGAVVLGSLTLGPEQTSWSRSLIRLLLAVAAGIIAYVSMSAWLAPQTLRLLLHRTREDA